MIKLYISALISDVKKLIKIHLKINLKKKPLTLFNQFGRVSKLISL